MKARSERQTAARISAARIQHNDFIRAAVCLYLLDFMLPILILDRVVCTMIAMKKMNGCG
jgi:hypothetical protein